MARQVGRPDSASQARLQVILIALAVWNLLAFLASLISSGWFELAGDGLLSGRAFAGTTAVLAVAYLYAARDPLRNRFVLWLAAVEQAVALFSMAFHWVRDDVDGGDVWLPMLVSAVFLILLIASMPRQTATLRA